MHIELHGLPDDYRIVDPIILAILGKLGKEIPEEASGCLVSSVPSRGFNMDGKREPHVRVYSNDSAHFGAAAIILSEVKIPGVNKKTGLRVEYVQMREAKIFPK